MSNNVEAKKVLSEICMPSVRDRVYVRTDSTECFDLSEIVDPLGLAWGPRSLMLSLLSQVRLSELSDMMELTKVPHRTYFQGNRTSISRDICGFVFLFLFLLFESDVFVF